MFCAKARVIDHRKTKGVVDVWLAIEKFPSDMHAVEGIGVFFKMVVRENHSPPSPGITTALSSCLITP